MTNPILSPTEKQAMLQRALRGELTPEDTARYIASIRASFLSDAAKKPKATATREKAVGVPETTGPLDFF